MAPILHLSLPVRDLDHARRFYVDVLGCEPGRVRADFIDVWFFGLQLTLQLRPDETTPDNPGVRHFGVSLDDASTFRAVVERLERHDVDWRERPTAHTDPALSGKTALKVADPSGNVLELKWYPDLRELLPPPT